MALKTLKCPNCGSPYNPAQYRCEYCGCYVINSDDKFAALDKITFEPSQLADADKYPGIYVFGRLLGKGERPIALGSANYFTGITSAGGKLLLTNRGLYFSAHGFNVGRQECKIPLQEIQDVTLSLNFFISQHIVVLAADDSHRFVVFSGKEWVRKIKDAVEKINAADDSARGDYAVELRKLKALLDEKIITDEEYQIKKRQILGI